MRIHRAIAVTPQGIVDLRDDAEGLDGGIELNKGLKVMERVE
jgi:hypothetical protein